VESEFDIAWSVAAGWDFFVGAICEPYVREEEARMMNGWLKFSTVLLKTVWKSIVGNQKLKKTGA
jgi:hypothetical protein